MNMFTRIIAFFAYVAVMFVSFTSPTWGEAPGLPDTRPLTMEGDIASELVAGVDRFLLRQLAESQGNRGRYWNRDTASPRAYSQSIDANRKRLAHILGLRDVRAPFDAPRLLATTSHSSIVAKSNRVTIHAVRWPVIHDLTAEGLLIVPHGDRKADIVAIPDAQQTPEQICGVGEKSSDVVPYALRLAESGCRVIVPTLINRRDRREKLPNREYLYRSAFELGRHLIGYELQKVLSAVDWFDRPKEGRVPMGVCGWGDGGMLALYAGALDERIDSISVSGYFTDRRNVWQEPLDRNVFGLLEQFGDAELASMIAPRNLVVEASRGPEVTLPGGRGAPARTVTPDIAEVRSEVARARKLVAFLEGAAERIVLVESDSGVGSYGSDEALSAFLHAAGGAILTTSESVSRLSLGDCEVNESERHERQFQEIDRLNQWLLGESGKVRAKFMGNLKTDSLTAYEESVESYEVFSTMKLSAGLNCRYCRQTFAPVRRTMKKNGLATKSCWMYFPM